jgi:hypothetical protein
MKTTEGVSMKRRTVLTAALLLSTVAVPLSASLPSIANADIMRTWCTAAQLKVTFGHPDGTAGTIYYSLTFTNTGKNQCSISGVPSVQPVADSVKLLPIGPAARNMSMGQMGVMHTLKKGQSTSAAIGFVETGNYTPSTCRPNTIIFLSVSLGAVTNRRVSTGPLSVCTKISSVTTRLLGPVH